LAPTRVRTASKFLSYRRSKLPSHYTPTATGLFIFTPHPIGSAHIELIFILILTRSGDDRDCPAHEAEDDAPCIRAAAGGPRRARRRDRARAAGSSATAGCNGGTGDFGDGPPARALVRLPTSCASRRAPQRGRGVIENNDSNAHRKTTSSIGVGAHMDARIRFVVTRLSYEHAPSAPSVVFHHSTSVDRCSQ